VIRALIVDDEPMARAKLRRLLRDVDDIEVVGEADTVETALDSVRRCKPDLLFLDVDMPGGTGFDAAEALGAGPGPLVVFATAYSEFAVRAFETQALDYLLKPFDADRLERTLARVRARLADPRHAVAESIRDVLAELRGESAAPAQARSGTGTFPERLLVPADAGFEFVRVEDIDWIGSADNYVEVNTARRRHLVRETMASVERRLDPGRFARIHRCTIINLARVSRLQWMSNGRLEVVLLDGERLPVGRAYRERLTRRWHGSTPDPARPGQEP
jgi:two-component system LytT family response regulator